MPLKTSQEWLNIQNAKTEYIIKILDFDGWRIDEVDFFKTPISQKEFEKRLYMCTIQRFDK